MQGDIFKADVHRAGQEWSRKLDTGIYWRRMLHHSVRHTASTRCASTLPWLLGSCVMTALLLCSFCLFWGMTGAFATVGLSAGAYFALKLTSEVAAHARLLLRGA